MFGLGMPEILMILAIALIVIGPKKLPELAKTMGRAMGEFKRAAQGMKDAMDMDDSASSVMRSDSDIKLQKHVAENDWEELEAYDSKTVSDTSALEKDLSFKKSGEDSSGDSIDKI